MFRRHDGFREDCGLHFRRDLAASAEGDRVVHHKRLQRTLQEQSALPVLHCRCNKMISVTKFFYFEKMFQAIRYIQITERY